MQIIASTNTFTETSRLVFDKTSECHSLAKLTHEINYHTQWQTKLETVTNLFWLYYSTILLLLWLFLMHIVGDSSKRRNENI